MDKKFVLLLMNAYVEDYKRDYNIYSSLEKYNIFLEVQSTPMGLAIERIFDMLHPDLCHCLIELVENGNCMLVNPETEVSSVEELYEALFEDKNNE